MRDWFAAFATPEDREMRATWATRATEPELAWPKRADSQPDAAVAHTRTTRATRATGAGTMLSVAHVAQAGAGRATSRAPANAEENPHARASVARVAHVAHEFDDCRHDIADTTDWREFFEERAAIRQYEAGYSRQVAERLAYGECIEGWWELHCGPHLPGLCAGCGEPLAADTLDLPDGARVHWERDREFTCLIAYGFARKRRAVAALAALGLQPPTGWEA